MPGGEVTQSNRLALIRGEMKNTTEIPWRYKHVTASVQVTSRPGILSHITVNHPDDNQGTPHAIVYDNTEAAGTNIIAIIDLTAGNDPGTLNFGIPLTTGLYIDIVGAAQNISMTVMYN